MKTKKIYIANLGVISCKEFVEPGENLLYLDVIKKGALVKKSLFGKKYIDLEDNKKYVEYVSANLGKEFIVPGTIKSFKEVVDNDKKHLSKNKILSLYRGKRRSI